MSMQRRKAINFIFPFTETAGHAGTFIVRGRSIEFSSILHSSSARILSSLSPPLLQGLPRSKTPQRCKLNLLAQSCTFWIRGKRPFKPLSKLPSLPSFSLSPPPGQRTYAGIGTRFKNILSRANFYLGRNLARLDVVI